jgi:cation transport ATPase-like protein
MRKPPRKKDEYIIDRRLRIRVLFSAAIIVAGTLFVYYFALSDDNIMSRRDQTMVCPATFTTHSPSLGGDIVREWRSAFRDYFKRGCNVSFRFFYKGEGLQLRLK